MATLNIVRLLYINMQCVCDCGLDGDVSDVNHKWSDQHLQYEKNMYLKRLDTLSELARAWIYDFNEFNSSPLPVPLLPRRRG
jgi:hypothetical protein